MANKTLKLFSLSSRLNTVHRCFSSRIPPLTSEKYKVERGAFTALTNKDITFFEQTLDQANVLTDPDEVLSYNVDWLKSVRGNGSVVLKPKSTEEVAAILRYCNDKNIAVTPQGGNTGLVGGSVPVFDEVIISTQRMNKILSIDEYSNTLVCQSGCILETLDDTLKERGMCMPLDLGAKGSCHIGGNVSTNAGGLRLIRYGSLHGSVMGVEVVSANGQVVDLMSNFKKDNTGYHLKHLFIGSEGTLGFVTKLSIFCPQRPKSVNVAFLGLESFDAVLRTFLALKNELGEILSSCEMIDEESLDCCVSSQHLPRPFQPFPFYVLVETSGSRAEHDQEKLSDFIEKQMENGLIKDGVIASEPSKIQELWKLRELIPASMVDNTYCFKYDISVPLRQFYEIVEVMRERLEGAGARRTTGYGHIGDSNLHLNIQSDEYDKELHKLIEPFVFEYVAKLKGSISAEHGIGFLKTKYLSFSRSPEALQLMKQIKTLMDPKGILNPYKVLPQD